MRNSWMRIVGAGGVGLLVWAGGLAGCGGDEKCTPRVATQCQSGATYYVDSCGNLGEMIENCPCGCSTDGSHCKSCACEPDCAGKECGADGCGGICGSCDPPSVCQGGTCVASCTDACRDGERRCVDDDTAYQACVCPPDDCCGWGDTVACEDGTVCDGGRCVATCQDECPREGDRACAGPGGYHECADSDGDGCLEWGDAVACPHDQICEDGVCVETCSDACTPQGAPRCTADQSAFETCDDHDGDGCLEWGGRAGCEPGEICQEGACVAGCQDECNDGSRRCADDGYQVCGDYDTDDCTEWSETTPCKAGETCSNGSCQQTCTSECATGERRCDGADGYQECGDFDADDCLEWSAEIACEAGESCSNGVCSPTCEDECAQTGDRQCTTSLRAWQECGDHDGDPCLEWGPAVDCAADETCEGGACFLVCVCDFNPDVCEAAVEGSSEACACDPDCDGAEACGSDGHCDSWCPPGVDPDCGCSCDYNAYCEAAAPGTADTCPCDPDCELHEQACSDDAHCDTYCPEGQDPDCGQDPCRARWISAGWRYGDEMWLFDNHENPDPDNGAPWVLLSPGLSGGSAEIFVAFAAEHVGCVDTLAVEVYGYDDSTFGDGAEMYLYNWDTGVFDLLPDHKVDHTQGLHANELTGIAPYIWCGETKCFVDAKLNAGAWDNTHVLWMEIWLGLSP